MDILGRMGSFFRIFDCTELRYRYLSMTVELPESLAAGTVVPFPAFPVALPQLSSQEIPAEPEAHTWVCDCTREGGLLCGDQVLDHKTAHHAYHAYTGVV